MYAQSFYPKERLNLFIMDNTHFAKNIDIEIWDFVVSVRLFSLSNAHTPPPPSFPVLATVTAIDVNAQIGKSDFPIFFPLSRLL